MTLTLRQETFESLDADWWELAPRAPAASVFTTPAWLLTWWRACRTTEELLLLAWRRDSTLCAVAPLMRSGDEVRFIAYSDLCDLHDFLVLPGQEEAFYLALLREADRAGWRSMFLDGIPDGSPTLSLFPQLAGAHGWGLEQALDEVSPSLDLPGSWDEYLASLGKKDRHELRRKLRRVQAAGAVVCRDVAGAPDFPEAFATFVDMLKRSREDKAAFLTPSREAFFYRIAEAMGQAGLLRLFFLELDGVRVAGSLCFDYGGAYYLYNSGYDPEYASLSVGLVLKALCLKQAIADGRTRFHFLRGSEPYKFRIGGRETYLCRLSLRR